MSSFKSVRTIYHVYQRKESTRFSLSANLIRVYIDNTINVKRENDVQKQDLVARDTVELVGIIELNVDHEHTPRSCAVFPSALEATGATYK